MDPDLAHHVRFDELSLAAFRARPALHRHQIAATEAHLAMAREATSAVDLLARLLAAGRSCDLARAAWCDRHANLAVALRALGDDEVAATVDAEVARVAASSDADFLTALIAASAAIERRRGDSWNAATTVAMLAVAAIDWATAGGDGARAEHAELLDALWRRAGEHDRHFTWAKVLRHLPYRQRLPFDDPQIVELGRWIETAIQRPIDQAAADGGLAGHRTQTAADAAGEVALPDLPAIAPLPVPELRVQSGAEAAAPYLVAFDALDAGDAFAASRDVRRRAAELAETCASAPAWLAGAAETGLLARLARQSHIDRAVAAATRAEARGQPHVAQHHRMLAAALEPCATATEVEHVMAAGAVCFDIEVAWHDLLVHVITRPVQAISAVEAQDQPWRRRAVAESLTALAALVGLALADALAAPRIAVLIDRVYLPLGQQITQPPGALEAGYGEVGLRPLPALRAAAAQTISDEVIATSPPDLIGERLTQALAQPRLASGDALRAHLVDRCAEIAATPDIACEGPPARLLLWGQPVTLAELHGVDVPSRRPRCDP